MPRRTSESHAASSSPDDPRPVELQPASSSGYVAGTVVVPKKKRQRPSKKDIPEYAFTDEQINDMVNFIKEHPPLYDKCDQQFANSKLKEQLWMELAEKFDPPCTFKQVRKFFEARRTDFGKIEKKESWSSAPARERTPREERIMRTWAFLAGHIAHEPTHTSQGFPSQQEQQQQSQEDVELGDFNNTPASSSSGDHSAYSLSRRQRQMLEQQNRPRQEEQQHLGSDQNGASQPTWTHESKAHQALEQILLKVDNVMAPSTTHVTFLGYLGTKLQRVAPANIPALEAKILELVTAVEEPTDGPSQVQEARQIIRGVIVPSTLPPPPQPAVIYQYPYGQPYQPPQQYIQTPLYQPMQPQAQPIQRPVVPVTTTVDQTMQQPQHQQQPVPSTSVASWNQLSFGAYESPMKTPYFSSQPSPSPRKSSTPRKRRQPEDQQDD